MLDIISNNISSFSLYICSLTISLSTSAQISGMTLFPIHRKDSAASVSTDFGNSTSWDQAQLSAQATHEISHSSSQQGRQETHLT